MQRISTDEVRARSGEFAAVVSKSEEMNKAIGTALIDMTAGLTNNMRQNLQIKTNKMCDDMLVLLSSLRRGKDLLDKVVIAYETADSNLKKEVEDWVGDTEVLTPIYAKVEEMRSANGFTQGEYWGDENEVAGFETVDGWVSWSASGCCAKAFQMQAYVTGHVAVNKPSGITDPGQIQAGDVIHYHYWANGTKCEHWFFVTAVNGDTISIGEGNYWGTGSKIVNYKDISLNKFYSNEYFEWEDFRC